jgi:hypothetical protein
MKKLNLIKNIIMKNAFHFSQIFFLLLTAGLLSGCLEDKCENTWTYKVYDPVYLTAQEIRQDIVTVPARTLKQPGKIYYYQDYLFVNELQEGIHIIDNRDPSNPVNLGFIKIPGNVDMAVRGDLLYANNYIDLVTVDISTPSAPVFVSRTEDVFPGHGFTEQQGYLVDWVATDRTEVVACDDPNWGRPFWFRQGGILFVESTFDAANVSGAGSSPGAVASGIGGSMARFTIASDHLYVVDESQLRVFDLANATQPHLANTLSVGWGIETIYPYGDKLFIGSNTGMFIYDNSDPLNPFQLAVFQHARACDPVFVSGNIAYVTLRDGTQCQTFTNQLDVVDVTEITQPRLLRSYPMHNPHGLSVSGDNLFICEGDEGLKVFNSSEWDKIDQRLLDHIKGFRTFDVITLDAKKLAIVVGKDGLYQFDFTDPNRLNQLSVIQVNN